MHPFITLILSAVAVVFAGCTVHKVNEEPNALLPKYDAYIKSMKIGDVLKKHFIDQKEESAKSDSFDKKDISCIGIKKDIAFKLVNVIEKEEISFDDLTDTARKLTEKIYGFIKGNNA